MSLSDNYTPIRVLGNGSTDEFSASWQVFNESYLIVDFEDASDPSIITPKVLGSDYTLSFDSSGFVVTFNTAPPNTVYVRIYRQIDLTQTNPFRTAKGFDGTVIEVAFDKLTGISQDQQDSINRAPQIPIGSSIDNDLPAPSAGKAIKWNDDADGFVNSEYDPDEQTELAEAAATTATTQAGISTTQAGIATSAKMAAEQAAADAEAYAASIGPDATFDSLSLNDSENQIILDADGTDTGTVTMATLTGSRTWTLPNKSGFVAMTSDIPGAASETEAGIVERATDVEAAAGVDTTRYITPKQLADNAATQDMILLETVTASSDAAVALDLDGTYKHHILFCENMVVATDNRSIQLRLSSDGGSSFVSSAGAYSYAGTGYIQSGSAVNSSSAGDTRVILTGSTTGVGNDTAESFSARIDIFDAGNASQKTKVSAAVAYEDNSNALISANIGGRRTAAAADNAVQITPNSGNITSGIFKLYGVK